MCTTCSAMHKPSKEQLVAAWKHGITKKEFYFPYTDEQKQKVAAYANNVYYVVTFGTSKEHDIVKVDLYYTGHFNSFKSFKLISSFLNLAQNALSLECESFIPSVMAYYSISAGHMVCNETGRAICYVEKDDVRQEIPFIDSMYSIGVGSSEHIAVVEVDVGTTLAKRFVYSVDPFKQVGCISPKGAVYIHPESAYIVQVTNDCIKVYQPLYPKYDNSKGHDAFFYFS